MLENVELNVSLEKLGVLQKGLFPGNSCAGKRLVATRQAGIQSTTLFRTIAFFSEPEICFSELGFWTDEGESQFQL